MKRLIENVRAIRDELDANTDDDVKLWEDAVILREEVKKLLAVVEKKLRRISDNVTSSYELSCDCQGGVLEQIRYVWVVGEFAMPAITGPTSRLHLLSSLQQTYIKRKECPFCRKEIQL